MHGSQNGDSAPFTIYDFTFLYIVSISSQVSFMSINVDEVGSWAGNTTVVRRRIGLGSKEACEMQALTCG